MSLQSRIRGSQIRWDEIRPPRPPDGTAATPTQRLRRSLRQAVVWLPVAAAIAAAASGLAVVASQQSGVGPDPIIRLAELPTVSRDTLIDINHASVAELATLPGIGHSRAEAIVQLRERRPFSSLVDLAERGVLRPLEVRAIADWATVYAATD